MLSIHFIVPFLTLLSFIIAGLILMFGSVMGLLEKEEKLRKKTLQFVSGVVLFSLETKIFLYASKEIVFFSNLFIK